MGDQAGLGMLCTAIYDFDGVRSDNLVFKKGDVITIIEMNDHGWWKGVNPDGDVGIFPYNYVEQIEPAVKKQTVYRAMADLQGPFDGALSFEEGDLLVKIKPVNEDWSEGKLLKSGESGVYPNNYFEEDEIDDDGDEAFEMQERIASYRNEEAEKRIKEEEEARKEVQRLEKERAEAQRKLKEQEQKRKEERERDLQRQKEIQEREAAQRKAETERRRNELEATQNEADRMREELRVLKEKLAEEERLRQETKVQMEKEAEEARLRAAEAEAEAERAKAEAAALRRQQEIVDANKSEAVKQKVEADNDFFKSKWRASMAFNSGLGPQDLPSLPDTTPITSVYASESQPTSTVKEVKTYSKAPEYANKELKKAEQKKKKNFMIQPVYVQDESDKQEILDVAKQNFAKLTAGPQDKVPNDKSAAAAATPEEPDSPLPSYEDVVGTARDARGRRKHKPKIPSKFAKLGGGDTCAQCGKLVAFGPEKLKALETTWHKECFKCTKCSKVLRFGTHVAHNNNPYCSGCHKEVTGISKYIR